MNRLVLALQSAALALVFATGSSVAADERAVLVFHVPAAPNALGVGAAPTCADALDVGTIVAEPSLYKALLGADPDAVREMDSRDAVLRQLAQYGHGTKRLVTHRDGWALAQCHTGCAVLPRGAHVRRIVLSDRHAGGGATIIPVPRRPGAPDDAEWPGSGSETDRVDMGGYGYLGLLITPGHRAVCVTAANWSPTQPTTQIVRVFFER